ncbi:2'-5' RNA ligase family protein [Candidatus Saccharibacteria bacterium]|nr:2'-5' RNA ligase family protein [Candidatus Saccharibacteria bacterium]
MTYSQKYCLVHFIKPVQNGMQFHMSEWPLHATLADVFAINRRSSHIDEILASKFSHHPSVKTTAMQGSILGTTHVVLLNKTPELLSLHAEVITILEESDAIFNTPEFNKAGFIPHSTIQQNERVNIGDVLEINSLSLVDMFPDDDWQQRKVLSTFNFS